MAAFCVVLYYIKKIECGEESFTIADGKLICSPN